MEEMINPVRWAMSETKTRNEAIYTCWSAGTSYSELAKEYGISSERVRQICIQESKSRKKEADPLYVAICEIVTDDLIAAKIFQLLKRNGVHTVAEVRKLTEQDMKRIRNCGPVIRDVLKQL